MMLFGRKKPAAAPAAVPGPGQTVAAIENIRKVIVTLGKREDHLNHIIEENMKLAKAKVAKKDRRGAMMCLKKNKLYEKEREKIQNATYNLEQEIIMLEGVAGNVEVFNAVKTGVEALKVAHGAINADAVNDQRDEIEEQMDLSRELSDAIAAPMGGAAFDDEEIAKELESIEAEEAASIMVAAPEVPVGGMVAPVGAPELPVEPVAAPAPVPVAAGPVAVAAGGDAGDERAIQQLRESMGV